MLKNKIKPKQLRLKNPLSDEIWICEDYSNVRTVDSVDFIEVHKENSQRLFWMNKTVLVKTKI